MSRSIHVGINYPGTNAELRGCVNDAENIADYLVSVGFVTKRNATILREATSAQICDALLQLARTTHRRRIANVFISFSGHGTSVPDRNGDEADGVDECICPSDYATCGVVTDDVLNDLLHKFNPATRITVMMDCCHSGTILDLPFRYVAASDRVRECDGALSCHPNVVMLSGCRDDQTSADAYDAARRESTGAMTSAFLDVVQLDPHVVTDAFALLERMRALLAERRMLQVPQLCTSIQADTKSMAFLPIGQV